MSAKFDPKKPVQTRSGRPVRILCTDRSDLCDPPGKIVALVLNEAGAEALCVYYPDGRCHNAGPDHEWDLVNVGEKETRWAVYCTKHKRTERYGDTFTTRRQAEAYLAHMRVSDTALFALPNDIFESRFVIIELKDLPVV